MNKVWKWILVIIGALVVMLVLRVFVFTSYLIPSSGMENALYQGDRIIVSRWSYGLRVPAMSLLGYRRCTPKPVKLGNLVVFNDPASPEAVIDERPVYISRCIGLPGDTLLLDTLFNVISNREKVGPDRKKLYSYPVEKESQMDSLLEAFALRNNRLMGVNRQERVRSFSRYEFYLFEQALGDENWIIPIEMQGNKMIRELVIPRKGQTIKMTPWNYTLYANTIMLHENPEAELREGVLYINKMPVESYTFGKDYHWMVSNNSINMADSRLFGFVPEDHLIGRAAFIWFSKEPNTGVLKGFRWSRILKTAR